MTDTDTAPAPRLSTGVPGLDDILCGGLTPSRLYLLEGTPGTGKTTLMSLLAGLETPSQGAALHKGQPITSPDPSRALIFQSYALMPWLSAAKNVRLAVDAVHAKKPAAERAALVDT